jgi:sugar phosphate isomerase/epimerase
MTAGGLLERAEALGVRVVQFADNLALHRLADTDLAALRQSAERRRIDVEIGTCGIDSANLDSYLRLAQFFRSPIVRVVLDTPDDQPTPDEVVATLRRVLPAFEGAGICLAIENHDRFPSATLAAILDRVDSPCAGICLDTANSLGCLEGIETVVEVLGPRAANLHIKDFEIVRPRHQKGFIIEGRPAGRGRLDIPRLLARLRALGRDPNAILELWPPPESDGAAAAAREAAWAAESVSYLRRLIPEWTDDEPSFASIPPAPERHGPDETYLATAATMAAKGVSTGPMGCGP